MPVSPASVAQLRNGTVPVGALFSRCRRTSLTVKELGGAARNQRAAGRLCSLSSALPETAVIVAGLRGSSGWGVGRVPGTARERG